MLFVVPIAFLLSLVFRLIIVDEHDDIELPNHVIAILDKFLRKYDKYKEQGRNREAREEMRMYYKWRKIGRYEHGEEHTGTK